MESERRYRWMLAAEDALRGCLISMVRGRAAGLLEQTAARTNGRRKERERTMVKLLKGYQRRDGEKDRA